MNSKRLAIAGLILMMVSGCATIKEDRPLCIATGALIRRGRQWLPGG